MQSVEKKTFKFNEGQQKAIDEIGQSLESMSGVRRLLLGGAGTGKTTTFQQVLRDYQQALDNRGDDRPIAVVAPTNKAVKVAKKMATTGSNLEFKTIHSLLGLSVSEKEGKKLLDKRETDGLNDYAAIIVDESSMINGDVSEQFFSECNSCDVNVIGVGDPNQLYPVGYKEMPFLNYFDSTETHRLTEVMRQKGSPAGLLVDFTRQAVEQKKKRFDPRNYPEYIKDLDNKGTWLLEGNEFYQFFVQAVSKCVSSADWDKTRFIAFHHKSIEQVNHWLRLALYGDHAEKEAFLPGEPIIALSPVQRSFWDNENGRIVKNIILPTASEGIVENAVKVRDSVRIDSNNYSYDIWLVATRVEEDGMHNVHQLRIIDQQSSIEYKKDLERLKKRALEDKSAWKRYYELKGFVDNCRVGYGLTVYSSQGSTFENVFIPGNDLMAVRDNDSRCRAWYVACSRASEKIILC